MLSEALTQALLDFRRERNWEQFHTSKNLAIAIAVEAGELLEQFQWTTEGRGEEAGERRRQRIRDEIADVAILLSYFAHDLEVNIEDAVAAKLAANAVKYPVDVSYGRAEKYDNLE